MQQTVKRGAILIMALGLAMAAAAGPTSAAVTLGQTAPGEVEVCGGETLFTEGTEAPGTPSYTIPSDGVITSWSVKGDDVYNDAPVGLNIGREGPTDYWTIIAATPLKSIPASSPIRTSSTAWPRSSAAAGPNRFIMRNCRIRR